MGDKAVSVTSNVTGPSEGMRCAWIRSVIKMIHIYIHVHGKMAEMHVIPNNFF